jgi:hypothetical protein
MEVDCRGTSKWLGKVYGHTQGSIIPSRMRKVREGFFIYLISSIAPPSRHERGPNFY